MIVPNYTRGLVLNRPVANQVDLSQIGAAGQTANAASNILDIGAQIKQRIDQTNDMTAVNEAVIKRKRIDIESQAELQTQWKDNPLGYARASEALYKERDKEIAQSLPSDDARVAYSSTAQRLNLQNYESDLSWETKASAEMFVNKADGAISDLEVSAYRGKPLNEIKNDAQATALTLGGVLSEDQVAEFYGKSQERIIKARLNGLIDTNPYEAKQELDSRDYDELLGADELNKYNLKTEKAIAENVKLQSKGVVVSQQLELVDAARSGEYILSPTSKEHQKAVDTSYAQFESELGQLPLDARLAATVDYVSQVGIIPSKLENDIAATLRNGSAEQVAQSSDLIEKIAVTKPSAIRQLPKEDRVLASKVVSNLNAGINKSQAVKFARNSFFQQGTDEYKQRDLEFKNAKIEFNIGDFTSFLADDPNEVPSGMVSDYSRLARSYYVDGGMNAADAKKLAQETISQNWGYTEIGRNKRWAKYAPEKVYDNGQGSEWIKEQLGYDATLEGIMSDDIEKYIDNLLLEIAPEDMGKQYPSYLIFEQDDSGLIKPFLTKDGKQGKFQPDYESSPEFKRLMEENNNNKKQAMIAAKRRRNTYVINKTFELEGITTPAVVGLGRAF